MTLTIKECNAFNIMGKKRLIFFGGEFLGGPVVRSPHFHCRGHRVNPQLGSKILHAAQCSGKKKKNDVFKLEFYIHSKQINCKCRENFLTFKFPNYTSKIPFSNFLKNKSITKGENKILL